MELEIKKKRQYVDNEQMYDILDDYVIRKNTCKAQGLPLPQIPEEIGAAIAKMANGFASRHNFRDYFFREDMVGDAIVAAIAAVQGYDPAKTVNKNAFGFFNKVIFWAFLRRIKEEKDAQKLRESLMFDGEDNYSLENGDSHHLSKDDWYVMYNNE